MKATDRPKAIFMMGGPAAGKSTVRRKLFATLPVIDCDAIKASHSEYDAKNPAALHEWSSMEAARAAYMAIGDGASFVFDGTGSTAEKYIGFMQAASAAGFETILVYVACPLATAIERNASRERVVPEHVVREKHSSIAISYEILSRYAETVKVVNN